MLKLTDLTVGYGDIRAVHGLGLHVAPGTVCALIGPNGAGKSSTLMAVAGHTRVIEGSITFRGRDITRVPAHKRASLGIAISPEGRRLFPDLTVAENLTVGGYSRPGAAADETRETVLDLFPILQDRLAQRAGTLSGGQQ